MKCKLYLIPNYGNDNFIIECINKFNGVNTDGILHKSEFRGCDVPVILNIEYQIEDQLGKLVKELDEINTDTYWLK